MGFQTETLVRGTLDTIRVMVMVELRSYAQSTLTKGRTMVTCLNWYTYDKHSSFKRAQERALL